MTRDLTNLWLVSGQIEGDAYTFIEVVEDINEAAAMDRFNRYLRDIYYKPIEESDVYINHIEPLSSAIDARLRELP